jgi:ligand-binding sensor protein
MALDVAYYKNAFHNVDIEKIFPLSLVKQIMQGFFWTNQASIAYLAATQHEIIRQDDSYSMNVSDTIHNTVCETYRKKVKGKPGCRDCDNTHLMECIENNISEVHTYLCWLGFQEFACPLTIENKVKAILISGQFIPKKDSGNIDPTKLEFIKTRISNKINSPQLQILFG